MITPKDNKKHVLLWIGYNPTLTSMGDVRFEIKPQHFLTDEMDRFFYGLANEKRLGQLFFTLLSRAWVTRLDIALDIYGCRLHDYIIGSKGSRVSEFYTNAEDFTGLRFNRKVSCIYWAIYEKVECSRQY